MKICAEFECEEAVSTGNKFCFWHNTCAAKQCGKLRSDESVFCPHHKLLEDERQADMERRMKLARKGKERKAEAREALKESPLRGYNPEFDKAVRQ